MPRDAEIAAFQRTLLETGSSRLPLFSRGHARQLARLLRRPPTPPGSALDRKRWNSSCDRIALDALKELVEKGQLEQHSAHNFAFKDVIDAPAPLRWSPGDPAPDFALPTSARDTVRLADFLGKPLVLVFIRGTW